MPADRALGTHKRLGRKKSRSGCYGEEKNLSSLLQNKSKFLDHPACGLSLYH
jgi:hypothetical protein